MSPLLLHSQAHSQELGSNRSSWTPAGLPYMGHHYVRRHFHLLHQDPKAPREPPEYLWRITVLRWTYRNFRKKIKCEATYQVNSGLTSSKRKTVQGGTGIWHRGSHSIAGYPVWVQVALLLSLLPAYVHPGRSRCSSSTGPMRETQEEFVVPGFSLAHQAFC